MPPTRTGALGKHRLRSQVFLPSSMRELFQLYDRDCVHFHPSTASNEGGFQRNMNSDIPPRIASPSLIAGSLVQGGLQDEDRRHFCRRSNDNGVDQLGRNRRFRDH